jgi:D-alanyl-D-alanine carboxypeptidase
MRRFSTVVLVAGLLAGCGGAAPSPTGTQTSPASPQPTVTPQPTPKGTPTAWHFPSELFDTLGEEPVSDELAAELQGVLEESANGAGLTATVIGPAGVWTGATGMATAERAMVVNDQLPIASITKTIVAAQVMQLVEAGTLALGDLAADRLPPSLDFNTNGATIEDLLSMRSGIPDYFPDDEELTQVLTSDPAHVWTLEEKLATIGPERGLVGQDREWEYIGTNYLMLGLIVEQATGRPIAQVLRTGVLAGDEYERLIFQPDEQPTDPIALPNAAPAATFEAGGGYLPSIANATMFTTEGAMASDAQSLALWFRNLCAGQVVSQASLDDMTDLGKRPEYGLGIFDRRYEYGSRSGALGHTGYIREGGRTAALCFQDPGMVVVVLANTEHDVETTAGNLWAAAS